MGIIDTAELTVTLRPGFHKECPVSDAKPVKEIVWDQSSQEWQTRFSISSHTVVCTILNVLECVQLSIGKLPITIILAKISSFALFEVVKIMLILAKIISILANIIYKST